MSRKIVIPLLVVIVVGGLGFWGVRRIQQARRAIADSLQTAEVRRGPLVATISTAGTVQSANDVTLVFQGAGQVKEVLVKEGDQVKAGQSLACLDTADAELQVSQAEAGLAIAEAQLDQAKKGASAEDIAAAQAALASAEENLKRVQAGPSATDLEVARLNWEQAKDNLWGVQAQRDATMGNSMATDAAKDQAQAAVASAEIAVEVARLQYEQLKQGPTESELRAAESQVAQARSSLARLTTGPSAEDLRMAEARVQQAEVTLQQAKNKLAQMCLTAPFEGTVTRLNLQVGQMAGATTQAGTLSSPNGQEIAIDMSEVDVARVVMGQEADITLDAIPERSFKGRVIDVAGAGTSTQGVVNFPVTVQLEQPDPAIKPGMTANVSIIVDRRENVLLVPSRAIRTPNGKHQVLVLREGQIVEVTVQVGLSGDAGTEVLGDTLKEGDVLVLNRSLFGPGGLAAPAQGGGLHP